MPFDPILRFKKSPSLDAAKYSVAWTRNGEPAGAGDVARTSSGDSVGYSARFGQHNPGVSVGDGDTIAASLRCVDASGLASAAVEPSVVVPSEPPAPPETVTLTLS
jgi:hypothetical protein